MTISAVQWITHDSCGRHEMGAGHPECPERLQAVEQAVAQSGIAALRTVRQAGLAPPAALLRAHSGEHVDGVLATVPATGYANLDADTRMNAHSADAALRAAGAVIEGVDAVLDGQARTAFCAVRPPGHHAQRANAMGFCLFDNIAVAACHALERGLQRVAILDFDVHYGNGTVDIFRGDRRVLVCNSYQYPLYPFWADGGGAANLVDVALAPNADGRKFRSAIQQAWAPALKRFKPELVLVSAGFDAHRNDPLANLDLDTEDFRWMGQWIAQQAEALSESRVVSVLEGGYQLDALGASVVAYLEGQLALPPQ